MSDLVNVTEAARELGVNKSTVSRYVERHGPQLDVRGTGRAMRFSLSKYRAHRSGNMATPITGESHPDAGAANRATDGDERPQRREPGSEVVLNEVDQIKLERARLALEKERREDAIARGQLVPVEQFEGLGQRVGQELAERLMQMTGPIITDISTASSEREKHQRTAARFREVMDQLARVFARHAEEMDPRH